MNLFDFKYVSWHILWENWPKIWPYFAVYPKKEQASFRGPERVVRACCLCVCV